MEAQYRLHQELFPQGHPYHHYAIGSGSDIKRITSAEIKAFFRRHYTPANDSDLGRDPDSSVVLPMIQKYFETLAAAPRPDPPQVPPLKRSMGQLLRHTERGTPAALFLAWLTPPIFCSRDAACDLLGHILSRGPTDERRQFAAAGDATDSISVQQISRRQQSVFAITTTLPAGSASATSRLQQIDESLAQIAQDGVSGRGTRNRQAVGAQRPVYSDRGSAFSRTCWLPINQDRGPCFCEPIHALSAGWYERNSDSGARLPNFQLSASQ